MSATGLSPIESPRRSWLAALVIGALATLAVIVLIGIGALSLPGLAVVALGGFASLVALLWVAPQALIVLGPALIHLTQIGIVFPYELPLFAFAMLVLLQALVTRPRWATQLAPVEIALAAYIAWGIFTGFWLIDATSWMLGIRKLTEGAVSLWLGLRLARLVPRSWYEAGLIAGSTSLTAATLLRRMSHGLSEKQLLFNRASATDLGWGTSNFVATLLLLLTPVLIEIAFRSSQRWMRVASTITVGAITILQFQIASRAATVLFVICLLVQLGWGHLRRAWGWLLLAAAAITGIAMSPIGEGVMARFSNVRDLGSMVVRLWYFREAWRRTIDHFPWGLGLNQGIVYPDHLQKIDPHNYWLVVTSELGIIGFVLWATVMFLILRSLIRVYRTPGWETLGRALLIAFFAGQGHTLVEPTFQGVQYQYVYFWLFGGYIGYHLYALERAPRGPMASTSR